ncbi:MAG: zinc ribbon domain-containing protein [Elusimicrobiota bacterium]
MPIYEYKCADCGCEAEYLVGMGDATDTLECKKCKSTKLNKLMSVSSVKSSGSSGHVHSGGCCGTGGGDIPSCAMTGQCPMKR